MTVRRGVGRPSAVALLREGGPLCTARKCEGFAGLAWPRLPGGIPWARSLCQQASLSAPRHSAWGGFRQLRPSGHNHAAAKAMIAARTRVPSEGRAFFCVFYKEL